MNLDPNITAPHTAIESLESFEKRLELFFPTKERRLGRISIGEISRRKIIPPDYVVDD